MSSLSQMSPVVPCCPPAASSSQTNNPRCRCRPYAVPLTVYLFNPLHSLFPPPVQLSLLGGTEKKDTQSRRVGAALSLKGRQRKRFVQRSTLTFLGLCLTKLKQTRRIGKQTCGATCKPRLRWKEPQEGGCPCLVGVAGLEVSGSHRPRDGSRPWRRNRLVAAAARVCGWAARGSTLTPLVSELL